MIMRSILLTFTVLILAGCGSSSSREYEMDDELRAKVEELQALAQSRESGIIPVIVRFRLGAVERMDGELNYEPLLQKIQSETGLIAKTTFRSFLGASYDVTAEEVDALANFPEVVDISYSAPGDSDDVHSQNDFANVVYDPRATIQCDGAGLSLSESAQTLIDAGIDVISSSCGIVEGAEADFCNEETPLKHFHRVHDGNVQDALNLGFEEPQTEEDPDTGQPPHLLLESCPEG